jgi:hypothetical protein
LFSFGAGMHRPGGKSLIITLWGFVTLSAFSCGAKLLEIRSAQQMTLMGECVECGGVDGAETLG